jgi:general stress protein 26
MTPTSEGARAAWQRFAATRFVMLTTIDEDGGFYSCPMTLQQAEDGVLWFFTSTTTPTAQGVRRDSRAAVAVMSDDRFFASAYGSAALVGDRARMRTLWDDSVSAWFPQGVEDPHLVLIRLDVERGEYWDADQSSLLKMFDAGTGRATGEHERGEQGSLIPEDVSPPV